MYLTKTMTSSTNSPSTTFSNRSRIMTLLIMLLSSNLDNADNVYVQPNLSSITAGGMVGGENVYSVANQTEALSLAWDNYLNGIHNGSDIYYDWETNYIIDNITFPENGTLSRRWNAGDAPLGTWFHQWQVAQQGTWDQRWYPASGCQYNGYGSGQHVFTQSWSQSTTWSVSSQFNLNVGKAAAFSIGASIAKTYGETGTRQIEIPQGSVGQTWTQKRMVWQNQQRQKCVRRHYGHNGLHCDAWSGYIHGDLPDTWAKYNTGSSIGYDHVQC